MKVLIDIRTKGDKMTLPGGIVLRDKGPDGHQRFVTHDYSIMDRTPDGERGYFSGGYFSKLSDALEDLTRRVRRAEGYDTGGSLDI